MGNSKLFIDVTVNGHLFLCVNLNPLGFWTLMCFFRHFFVGMFCVIVTLGDPFMTHLQCSDSGKEVLSKILGYMAPSIVVQSSCTLRRKTAPKLKVSPLCSSVGISGSYIIPLSWSYFTGCCIQFRIHFKNLCTVLPCLTSLSFFTPRTSSALQVGKPAAPGSSEIQKEDQIAIVALEMWNNLPLQV